MKISQKFNFGFEKCLIERIRSRFLEEYVINYVLYEETDVKLIKFDDYWIERFLTAHDGDEDKTYHNVIETLRWYKLNEFCSLEASYFPEEFYRTGAFFKYEPDRNNYLTLHFRVRYLRRIRELKQTLEYFAAFMFYNIDRLADGRGWIFVVDFKDSGLANADFDMFKYIIFLLKTHFPAGLVYILIVDLPWILRTFWSMVKQWIPSDKGDLINCATRNDIDKFIEKENLPDYLNGTCKLKYKGKNIVPKGCPNVFEYTTKKLNLNEQVCKKIVNIYKPILDELQEE